MIGIVPFGRQNQFASGSEAFLPLAGCWSEPAMAVDDPKLTVGRGTSLSIPVSKHARDCCRL
jgi:hypothetical protein